MKNTGFTDLLISNFSLFLQTFDKYCPFSKPGQLSNHLATKRRLREVGWAAAALKS